MTSEGGREKAAGGSALPPPSCGINWLHPQAKSSFGGAGGGAAARGGSPRAPRPAVGAERGWAAPGDATMALRERKGRGWGWEYHTDLVTLARIPILQVKKGSPALSFRGPGGGCGWKGAQGYAPRVQTRQRSRRLDLPWESAGAKAKGVANTGQAPSGYLPHLHRQRGHLSPYDEGGEGGRWGRGESGGGGEVKGEKKTYATL